MSLTFCVRIITVFYIVLAASSGVALVCCSYSGQSTSDPIGTSPVENRASNLAQAIATASHPQTPCGLSAGPATTQVECRLTNIQDRDKYSFKASDAPQWRKLLNNRHVDIPSRICAARFLLECNDESAQTYLSSCLESNDIADVCNATSAILAFEQCHGDLRWADEKLLWLLQTRRICPRQASAEIYESGDQAAESNAAVRELCGEVIAAVGRPGNTAAVPTLLKLAGPEQANSFLFVGSVEALGSIGDGRAIPLLLGRLKQNPEESDAVIGALGSLRYRPCAPLLLKQLTAEEVPTPERVRTLCDVFVSWNDTRAVPALEKLLPRLEDASTREYVELAVISLRDDDPFPALARFVDTNASSLNVQHAIVKMASLHDDRAVPILRKIAETSPKMGTRLDATGALGTMNTKASLIALVELYGADVSEATEGLKALDPQEFWKQRLTRELEETTGESFGPDPDRWREYLKK